MNIRSPLFIDVGYVTVIIITSVMVKDAVVEPDLLGTMLTPLRRL